MFKNLKAAYIATYILKQKNTSEPNISWLATIMLNDVECIFVLGQEKIILFILMLSLSLPLSLFFQ